MTGRQVSTGRQVAIKKIKVGQMKEGLDQSAIREVRYLREMQHPNVIEVRPTSLVLLLCTTKINTRQLLDVFSSKTNLNLVLEFLETDLEAVIKDRSSVFLPADIKSWMAMTVRGLEYCHRNWLLHRVRDSFILTPQNTHLLACSPGFEAQQFAHRGRRPAQDSRFRSCS
jgi:cyclin-dependent kinase 7